MSRRRQLRRLMQWKRYLRRCNHVCEWRHRPSLGFVRQVYRTTKIK